MTITPNQNFKHGGKLYCVGMSYEASDDDASYFMRCGWVGEPQQRTTTHSLDIHDGQLGHSAEV